jgi:RNA recognition motif-containing protein
VATNCYVGNLRYGMTGADLQDLFERQGTVQSPPVIVDRVTGRPNGSGFVETASAEELEAGTDAVNGTEVNLG